MRGKPVKCYSCQADTTNGLALCDLCQRFATSVFEMLPIYFRNLARWRPGRAGSRPVPGSRVLYDGERSGSGDRVSRALDEAGTDLVGWAEVLADDRPEMRWPLDLADLTEVEQAIRLCEIFTGRLTTIATLEWCGEFVRNLSVCEALLRGLTETSVPGWYAGACTRRVSMEGPCGAPTYVVPGLTWVTCRTCGATTYARDHLETILNEARDWVARPMRLAEAAVALVDTEMSVPRLHKRISKWGERGRIAAIDTLGYARELNYAGEMYAPKRYLFGDVLALLFAEGETRLDEDGPAKSAECATVVAVGRV
jgi:hypothetical protein